MDRLPARRNWSRGSPCSAWVYCLSSLPPSATGSTSATQPLSLAWLVGLCTRRKRPPTTSSTEAHPSKRARAMSYKVLSTAKCFGGTLSRVQHASAVTKTDMIFAVFMPEAAEGVKVPALYYLSGLTCTDENFMGKAGAQRAAAQHGIALIAPDTSPRTRPPVAAATLLPASSLLTHGACARRVRGLRFQQGRWL